MKSIRIVVPTGSLCLTVEQPVVRVRIVPDTGWVGFKNLLYLNRHYVELAEELVGSVGINGPPTMEQYA